MRKGIRRMISIALIALMLTTLGPLEGFAVTLSSQATEADVRVEEEPTESPSLSVTAQNDTEAENEVEENAEQSAHSHEKLDLLREQLQQSFAQLPEQRAAYLAKKAQNGNQSAKKNAARKAEANSAISYDFDEATKTLTFTGTGAMDDYGDVDAIGDYDTNFDMSTLPPWYSYADRTETVVIGEGITALGSCSFMLFDQMKTIQLPSTLERIGDYAFAFTDVLDGVVLPSGLTELGYSAFMCSGLSDIEIPGSVTTLDHTFQYCANLNNVVLREGVKTLTGAFSETIITKLIVPSTVEESEENYIMCMQELYNYSGNTTIMDQANYQGLSPIMKEAYRWMIKEETKSLRPDCNVEGPLDYQALVDHVNAVFGTDYTFDELVSLSDENSGEAPIVYCMEESKEHTQVKRLGLKHYLILEDGSLAESLCPDYGTGTAGDNITWHMDFETHTLVFEGYGTMSITPYHESEYPWSVFAEEIEKVMFVCGDGSVIENLVRYAFYNCKRLKDIVLPEGLKSIGSHTFSECTSLESVAIPDSVTTINSYAFDGCAALQKIELGSGLTDLSYSVFRGCSSLSEIVINEGNTKLYLQDGCLCQHNGSADSLYLCLGNVTQLVIPEIVTQFVNDAFSTASSLEKITLHNQIWNGDYQSVNELAQCPKLQEIVLDEENPYYSIEDGVLYNKEMTAFLFCPRNKTFVSIPETVTQIGEMAFAFCEQLKEITLPENISGLGWFAFRNCTGLEKLTVLNPECSLNYSLDLPKQTVIYGYPGSKAESYATENGNTFVPIQTLVSVALKNLPSKTTYYTYEEFQRDGLRLSATYDNGFVAEISSDFKVSGFKKGQVGKQTLTVEYQGYTMTFDITVLEVPTITAGAQETITEFPISRVVRMFVPSFDGEYTVSTNGALYVYDKIPSYWGPNLGSGSTVDFTALAGKTYYIELNRNGMDTLAVFLRHKHVFDETYSETCTICGEPITALMQGSCGDQLNYVLYDEGTLRLTGTGKMTSHPWSDKMNVVKRVVLTAGMTSIADHAFEACNELQEIVIPVGVEEIGEYAFSRCQNLKNVTLPDSLKTIGKYAFNSCSSLKEMILPEGVVTISQHAFSYCRNLESVTLPDSLTTIENYAFSDCDALKEMVIPAGLSSFDTAIWYSCDGLESIHVSEDNPNYSSSDGVLYNKDQTELIFCLPKKESISFPNTLKTIKSSAFTNCSALTTIVIPNGVETIESRAFNYCNKLESITLPDSLKKIASQAIYSCNTLKEIIIPACEASFSADVWYDSKPEVIYISNDNQNYSSIDGVMYNKDQTALIYCPPQKETVSLPETLEKIQRFAFYDCNVLKNITIPDRVETIEENAFYNCSVLQSLVMPDSVKSIGSSAFYYCSKLKNVSLSNNLKSIESYTFSNCIELTEIVIPNSVERIGYDAFYRCNQLSKITFENPNCMISRYSDTIPDQAVIYGYLNSTASSYANQFNRTFVSIDIDSVGIKSLPTKTEYQIWEDLDTTGLTLVVTYQDGRTIDEIAGFTVNGFEKGSVGTQTLTVDYFGYTASFDVTVNNYPIIEAGVQIAITLKPNESYFCQYTSSTNGTFIVTSTNVEMSAFDETPTGDSTLPVKTGSRIEMQMESGHTYYFKLYNSYWRNIDASILLKHQHIPTNPFSGLCSECGEPLDTIATGSCGEQVQYTLYQEGTLVISGEGKMTSHPWNSSNASRIKTVIMQNGVTTICDYAFNSCNALESAQLSNTLSSIGRYAFSNTALQTIDLPYAISTIGDYAFNACTGLTHIQLPAGLKTIGNYTFYNCTSLESVSFAEESLLNVFTFNGHYYALYSDQRTWDEAVAFCEAQDGHLATITSAEENDVIAAAVANAGVDGFLLGGNDIEQEGVWTWITGEPWEYTHWSAGEPNNNKNQDMLWVYSSSGKWDDYAGPFPSIVCEWESAEDIPCAYAVREASFSACRNSPITIGSSAFSGCTALADVVLSDTVSSIGYSAFSDCEALKAITFPGELKMIGTDAFKNTGLEIITFEANVGSVGNDVFKGSPLHEIVLGDGTEKIEPDLLRNCSSLMTVSVSENNPVYSAADGVLLNKEQTKLLCCPQNKSALSIPETVTEIDNDGFHACDQLLEVILPVGLIAIGERAFMNCTSLQSIAIPETVTKIGTNAFAYCKALTSVEIPAGISKIENYTFSGCTSLQKVSFPDTLTQIGQYAFASCTELTRILIPRSVQTIENNAFNGCTQLATVEIDATEQANLVGIKLEAEDTHIVSGNPNWTRSSDLASGGKCLDLGKDFDFDLWVQNGGSFVLSERACYNNRSFDLYLDNNLVGTYSPNLYTSGNNDRYYTDFEITTLTLTPGIHNIRIISSSPPIFDFFTITPVEEGAAAFLKTSYSGLRKVGKSAFANCEALSSVVFTGSVSNAAKLSIDSGNEAFVSALPAFTHAFNEDVVEEQASCTKAGKGYYLCADCGYRIYYSVDKLQHEYELTEHAATDGHEAYKEYVCKNCGDTYTELYPASAVEGFTGVADANKISLSWLKAVEASVSGYEIFRKAETEESFTLLKTVSSRNTLAYTDGNLDDGIYRYKIRAMKGSIAGTFTDEIAVSTIPDTQAPCVLSAGPKAKTVQNGTITLTASAEDNVAVTKLVVSASSDKATWDLLYTSTSNKLQYRFDTSAYADGTVYLKYVAYDKAGNQSEDYLMEYTLDNTAPAAVENLHLVDSHSNTVTLAWNDTTADDAARFILQVSNGSSWKTINDKITTLGYNVTGLAAETTYRFRVACIDMVGNLGVYSEILEVKTKSDTTPPVITRQTDNSGAYNSSIVYQATIVDDCEIKRVDFQVSTDGENWVLTKSQQYQGVTTIDVTYTLDLTSYDEGLIRVRAIAEDRSGNISNTEESAPFVEYLIDKTAPAKPKNVSATGKMGHIQVAWSTQDDGDTAAWIIYRSASINGKYEKIAQISKETSYNDRNLESGSVYYYKVSAVDHAGNESGFSEIVSGTVEHDVEAPVIHSISPASGSAIGKKFNNLSVLASDNACIDKVVFELSLNQNATFSAFAIIDGINKPSEVVSATINTAALSDEDEIRVRVKAVDKEGNESDYSEAVTYHIDNTPPEVSGLSADITSEGIKLSWKCAEPHINGFIIKRSIDNGSFKQIASIPGNDGNRYTYLDAIDSVQNGDYIYRIDAIDLANNQKSFNVNAGSVSTGSGLNPVARLDSLTFMEIKTEEVFSAENSYDQDGTIVSYHWDFGDGTGSNSKRTIKAYESVGNYQVVLTVVDNDGNESSVKKEIIVEDSSNLGEVTVKLISDQGTLSKESVIFDIGTDKKFETTTDSSGIARCKLSYGEHSVSFYKSGYLPAQKMFTVNRRTNTTIELIVSSGELVSGDFEVHRMTFDEIVASGIDINNPANQVIYEANVTVYYGGKPIQINYIRNNKEIISQQIEYSSVGAAPKVKWIPNDYCEIVAVVFLPIRASYLKQFYSASLTIINNADEQFELVNCSSSIDVPNGLTLVKASDLSPTIKGGETSTANYILRGDKEGTYKLSATFNGVLADFDIPVTSTFAADENVVVYGTDSVKLRVELDNNVADNHMRFNLALVNNRDVPVYCPQIDIMEFAVDIFEKFKKELAKEDTSNEDIRLLNVNFLSTYIKHADGTLGFLHDQAQDVKELEPHEALYYEYSIDGIMDLERYEKIKSSAGFYFNHAVVDCADEYAPSVEIVVLGDGAPSTIEVSDEQYIQEHLDFISSKKYADIKKNYAGALCEAVSTMDLERYFFKFTSENLIDFKDYNEAVIVELIGLLNQTEYFDPEQFEKAYISKFNSMLDEIEDVITGDEGFKSSGFTRKDVQEYMSTLSDGNVTSTSSFNRINEYLNNEMEEKLADFANQYATISYGITLWKDGVSVLENITRFVNFNAAMSAFRNSEDCLKQSFKSLRSHLDINKNAALISSIDSFLNSTESEEQFAKEISNQQGKMWLRICVDKAKPALEKAFKKAVDYVLSRLLPKAGMHLNDVAGVLNDVGPAEVILSVGTKIINACSNGDTIYASLQTIHSVLTPMVSASFTAMHNSETQLLKSPTLQNARQFDSDFKFYKQLQLMTCREAVNVENAKHDAAFRKLFSSEGAQKELENSIMDCLAQTQKINLTFCHVEGHEVSTKGAKVFSNACPTKLTVLSKEGETLAVVTNSDVHIYDPNILATVYKDNKMVSLPISDDYLISIEAVDEGVMTYSVYEYDDALIRTVDYDEINLTKGDSFIGLTSDDLSPVPETYQLIKNESEPVGVCTVYLNQVKGIRFMETNPSLEIGSDKQMTVAIDPINAENKNVIFKVEDEEIATISEDGILHAVGTGTTQVKASSVDGGYIAIANLTVYCDHKAGGEMLKTTPATCTGPGTITYTCSVCGDTYTETIDPLGHAYGEWTVVQAPTCQEEGVEERICANDSSHTETRSVPIVDHTDDDEDGLCDFCEEKMTGNGRCNYCGKIHIGFGGFFTRIIHAILYFFAHLFGKM